MNSMRRRFLGRLVATPVLVAWAASGLACSGSSAGQGPSCPDLGTIECPDVAPSYKSDIQPILAVRCYPCHGPGGIEYPTVDLTSYRGVVGNLINLQVSQCMMPPPDAGQPTLDERIKIAEWAACSYPNN
jgi:hypothetical protein